MTQRNPYSFSNQGTGTWCLTFAAENRHTKIEPEIFRNHTEVYRFTFSQPQLSQTNKSKSTNQAANSLPPRRLSKLFSKIKDNISKFRITYLNLEFTPPYRFIQQPSWPWLPPVRNNIATISKKETTP